MGLLQQLPGLLAGPLSNLDLEALRAILAALPEPADSVLSAEDCSDVWSYAWGKREPSTCSFALKRAALVALRRGDLEPPQQQPSRGLSGAEIGRSRSMIAKTGEEIEHLRRLLTGGEVE